MSKENYRGIWVYIEQADHQAQHVGLELLHAARDLADTTGEELTAVILADDTTELVEQVTVRYRCLHRAAARADLRVQAVGGADRCNGKRQGFRTPRILSAEDRPDSRLHGARHRRRVWRCGVDASSVRRQPDGDDSLLKHAATDRHGASWRIPCSACGQGNGKGDSP